MLLLLKALNLLVIGNYNLINNYEISDGSGLGIIQNAGFRVLDASWS